MNKLLRKVAVAPCAGIGQIFGAITREVGYRLVEDVWPEKTVLVCPPALAVDVREDLEFIHGHPVVVLNGCQDRCATKLVLAKGGRLDAEVYLPDILKSARLSLQGEKRSRLGPKSQQAIELMTEQAAQIVAGLLSDDL